jgi:soluble lytic murein transglycosylase-like protein
LAPLPQLERASPSRRAIESLVWQLAPQYGLDPNLVVAVIATESGFRADAVSPKGATGLMQLIPDTARRFGVENSYDPEQNLRGGMSYLRWLLSHFRGDIKFALAAYNAGERAVERYAGIPPYAETKDYVVKVMRAYPKTSHPF